MNGSDNGWARRHARSIVFVLTACGVAGIAALAGMPVSLFPRTTFPRVVVTVDAGDRPADRMEVEVTVPVETAVRSVPGTRRVRSTTSRGSAEISITFAWNINMIAATLQVESAINQARAALPPGTSFEVRRMDPTVFPVLAYSLTSEKRSPVELRDLALYQIRPALSTVPGVARVGVLGGDTREIQVVVDPARLAALSLTVDDVAGAVGAANNVVAVGRTEDLGRLYLVLGNTQFTRVEQIADTVIKTGAGGVVRIEDVATVQRGVVPRWTRVRADGHRAVLFQVYQQPDGDTLAIAENVRRELDRLRPLLPSGVRIATWYDQSELIRAAALSVRDALAIGVVFAFVVLLLFLKNYRAAVIAVVSVPLTLAVTTLVLAVLGQSFNIMTLGGMAAAVGLIIDDALVVIEQIVRRAPMLDGPAHARVLRAVREFVHPLVGSSTATVIVFAPMAFLSGVTGAFFKALALTIASSLIVSLLIAWILVPLLAERVLGGRLLQPHKEPPGPLARRYERSLRWLLSRPWSIVPLFASIVVVGLLAYTRTGSGFMPAIDEGGFVLDYVTPPGTSLTETDRLLRQVEDVLEKTPEVQTYSLRTGLALGGDIQEANAGDFFVRLKRPPRRGIEEIMGDVRARVHARVPGIEIEMAQLMEDLIGDLTAVPQPIEVKLFSDDESVLRRGAPRIAEAVAKIRGIVDVRSGIVLAGDALDIRVNRDTASLEGVTPSEVTRQVASWVDGVVTTEIQRGPKLVGVRVWTPAADRTTAAQLREIMIRAPDGHRFPLRRVAHIELAAGQAQIAREDLKRMAAVTARIAGRDLGSTVAAVRAALARPGLIPAGTYYRMGGLYEEQQAALRNLTAVFGAAVALVFAVLLYLYERFRVAACTLLPALGAAAAAFAGLWLTGTELNIAAMMGLTMIVGIVTEVSVFYVSAVTAAATDDSATAFVEAGLERARPIIMTALVASLALLPIALSIGQGAAMLQPMAIAIIAGLAVEVPLALVFLPVALRLAGWHPGAAP